MKRWKTLATGIQAIVLAVILCLGVFQGDGVLTQEVFAATEGEADQSAGSPSESTLESTAESTPESAQENVSETTDGNSSEKTFV